MVTALLQVFELQSVCISIRKSVERRENNYIFGTAAVGQSLDVFMDNCVRIAPKAFTPNEE
jgi:hypothetical protein